jgi:RecA/RadA recombinase
MARNKENQELTLSPFQQIQAYLKDNKADHYAFDEYDSYTISSGSLLLDIEMGGGIRPGIVRFSGLSEGGKTSCALSFARNFQQTVKNGFVVYIKSEGRLSEDMLSRSGIDTSNNKWVIYPSNVYESVITMMRNLVKDNQNNTKYLFIIDSMDALVPRNDIDKPFEEANKVAGGSLLSSDFLRKMALGLSSKGHICIMISQVRSSVVINPYAKTDPKLTNASGGNALLHYSDWILEFQQRHKADLIFEKVNGKDEIVGHFCKIIFRKTTNEKTNKEVRYPIRYGRSGGKSVWVEQEITDSLLMFEMISQKGAWITVSDGLISELAKANLQIEKQHQGMDNFRKFLESNQEITNYLFNKFKSALTVKV